ncbi:hypothetical protein Mapa_016335 [Marchantia paleacea]|nr:hypothetical protein Mapa_016335 [Marchantia paleacea]
MVYIKDFSRCRAFVRLINNPFSLQILGLPQSLSDFITRLLAEAFFKEHLYDLSYLEIAH